MVFPPLTFNFINPKSISVLNFVHLKFIPIWCSNPLLPKETLLVVLLCYDMLYPGDET
jgi:hypothetical protein